MKTIINTAAVIVPLAVAAILALGMNEPASAATVAPATFSGAPLLLGAGLVALVGLNRTFRR